MFFLYRFRAGGRSGSCLCCSISIVSFSFWYSSVPNFFWSVLHPIQGRPNASQFSLHYQAPSAAATAASPAFLSTLYPSKRCPVDAIHQTAAPPSNHGSSSHVVPTGGTFRDAIPATSEKVSVTQPCPSPLFLAGVHNYSNLCHRSLSTGARITSLPSFFSTIGTYLSVPLHQYPRSKLFSSFYWHYSATN